MNGAMDQTANPLSPRRSDWGRDPAFPLTTFFVPELLSFMLPELWLFVFSEVSPPIAFALPTGVTSSPTWVASAFALSTGVALLDPSPNWFVFVIDSLGDPTVLFAGWALPTGVSVLQAMGADVASIALLLPAAAAIPLPAQADGDACVSRRYRFHVEGQGDGEAGAKWLAIVVAKQQGHGCHPLGHR
jgi:hypothetical protein